MAELVTKSDLVAERSHLDQVVALLEQKIETQTLRLTVRLGVLLAAGIAVLGAVVKLI